MPRYRFDWRNIDAELLDRIAADRSDPEVAAVDWLRQHYGARPRERFVAEFWPVLRETWLAEDADARTAVVEALHSWSLGDLEIDVSAAEGQLDYLRSCRNQVTLRRAVLEEFVLLGEAAPELLKRSAPPGLTWTEFEERLSATLASLEPQQFLILPVRGSGAGIDERGHQGSAYFVQFAQGGDEGFRAEAVSDAYLVGDDKLTRDQIAGLVRLGWRLPSYAPGDERGDRDPHASTNWFRDWDEGPVPFGKVASLAVGTLREVFAAESPVQVEYVAFDNEGSSLDLPGLGLVRQQERERPSAPAKVELPRPTSGEELRAVLRAALAELLETDDVEPDGDGDFAVNAGSTVVYVRALSEVPVVRLFSPVLTNVTVSPALLEAANDISRQYALLRAVWDGEAITLVTDLIAVPFVAEHLGHALSVIGHFADELDDQLQDRFGGRTLLGAGTGPTALEGNAGYL